MHGKGMATAPRVNGVMEQCAAVKTCHVYGADAAQQRTGMACAAFVVYHVCSRMIWSVRWTVFVVALAAMSCVPSCHAASRHIHVVQQVP